MLNKYYNLLKNELPSEAKTKLVLTQRAWLTWRDKKIDFLVEHYGEVFGRGSIAADVLISTEVDMVKKRTLELKALYMDYKENDY